MAKEKDPKKPEIQETKSASKAKPESSNKLFIMMFGGVIVIQLVIIIVAVYFFLNKDSGGSNNQSSKDNKTEQVADKGKTAEKEQEKTNPDEKLENPEGRVFSYTTRDIIVNPKGTSGKRYLMAQVAIFVSDEKMKKEISEEREAQVNGIVNQYLASKTVDILDNIDMRDSLAIELKGKLNNEIPGNTVKKVYFSKFVIQ